MAGGGRGKVHIPIGRRHNGTGEMNVGGTFLGHGSEFVHGSDDACGIEMPLDEETIGGHTAVQRAGGNAVEIGDVAARNGAKAVEVEICVFGFEGIKGPLDKANAAAEGVFALRQLQLTTDAAITMGGENGGHVGVKVGRVVMKADEGFGEADHGVAIEGAKDLSTRVVGDDVSDVRLSVEFGVGPHFAGDLDATVKVGKGVKRADGDVGHRSQQFAVISFQYSVIRYQLLWKIKANDNQESGVEERSRSLA